MYRLQLMAVAMVLDGQLLTQKYQLQPQLSASNQVDNVYLNILY